MNKTTLRKVGGSIMLAVPPALLDALDLEAGSEVSLTVQQGRLMVEPKPRRRYSLTELLANCKPKARRSKQDREWASSKPVGTELI
ncbi:MAG: antitoxin [Bryobacteraceae bacterium]|nr:antitoxin [Bryobacteraceae bacterium]